MILKFEGFCMLVASVKGMCDLALHCFCSLCSFFNYEVDFHFWIVEIHGRLYKSKFQSQEEKEDCRGRHKARHAIKSYNEKHENKQNHTHIIMYS